MFDLRKKDILITGGTGSFGKKCAEILLENTTAVDSLFSAATSSSSTKCALRFRRSRLRYFIGDVRDVDRLRRAMVGIDVVIHAAALKQVQRANTTPLRRFRPTSTAAERDRSSAR